MDNLLVVLAVVLLSTLVQSTFSFGGALIALPLLALVVGVKNATVLMTMLSGTIAAIIVSKKWRHVEVGSAWRLIVSACAGIPFGILFLAQADGTVLIAVLAIAVMFFSVLSLLRLDAIRIENNTVAYAFGLVSGLFGGAFNISGPPVVLYGSLADWNPERFRATIQCYALFTNAFAIVGHAFAGNITRGALTLYVFALPIVAVSVWLGNIIHRVIPGERYAVIVKVLLLVLGASLLYTTIK